MKQQTSRRSTGPIVRKRTGCQNCKTRRKKCDETRPECQACIHRGLECGGYERSLMFKDISKLAAERSRKFEAARWSAIRCRDERRRVQQGNTAASSASPVAVDHQGHENASESVSEPREEEIQGVDPTQLLTRQFPSWVNAPENLRPEGLTVLSLAPYDALFDQSRAEANLAVEQGSTSEQSQTNDSHAGLSPRTGYSLIAENGAQSIGTEVADGVVDEGDSLLSTVGGFEEGQPFMEWNSSLYLDQTLDNSMMGDPMIDCHLSTPYENGLIRHFDEYVLSTLPVCLSVYPLFSKSSCFRSALLALSEVDLSGRHLRTAVGSSRAQISKCQLQSKYYRVAVDDLNQQIYQADNQGAQEHASTALLLAYHEFHAGSPRGARDHASTLDFIASKSDFSICEMPDLLKAWRLLRYDMRLYTMPTRLSSMARDDYEICSLVESQLAIRDILSSLLNLLGRLSMESPFTTTDKSKQPSASEQACSWMCSVLGRNCDQQQRDQGDFHSEDLSYQNVLHRCKTYKKRLDSWYGTLCDHDHPIPQCGREDTFLTSPSCTPIMTYKFSNPKMAFDYVMYLLSRMICNYLESLAGISTTPFVSDTYAQMIVGIAAATDISAASFTVLRLDMLLLYTTLLCDNSQMTDVVLYGLLPRLMRSQLQENDLIRWAYGKSILELNIRERHRGRAIRYFVDGADAQDAVIRTLSPKRTIVAFGDYFGKGHFRDCYTVNLGI